MIRSITLMAAFAIFLSACTGLGPVTSRDAPPIDQADAFAIAYLDALQPRSFAEHREFCGHFILLPNGDIGATPPVRGTMAGCNMAAPSPDAFASYHTHGAYDLGYDNEVPSSTDVRSDVHFGMDGYVSTPGGRVWRVDYVNRQAIQICGRGCVAVDPDYSTNGEGKVALTYSMQQLAAR